MNFRLKSMLQSVLNRNGYHIRRVNDGVNFVDAYHEQSRLLQNEAVEVIFEVGAADGRDCLRYAAMFPGAKIYAFEPGEASYAKLLECAKASPAIVPMRCALSDQIGTATFHLTELGDASSLLLPRKTGSTFDVYLDLRGTVDVPTDTIDNICKERSLHRLDLLKMDAQGAELNILKGAEQTLALGKIALIYTEVQFLQVYQDAPQFDKIMRHLTERGFELYNLFDLVHNQKGQLAWGDAVFVRKGITI